MASLDEELQAHYEEELERRKQEERLKRENSRSQGREFAKSEAKSYARRKLWERYGPRITQSVARQFPRLAARLGFGVGTGGAGVAGTGLAAGGGAVAAGGTAAAGTAPIWGMVLIIILIILLVIALVIGFIFFLYSLCNSDNVATQASARIYSKFSGNDFCAVFDKLKGATSRGGGVGQSEFCNAPATLAQQYSTPYPAQNDPDLQKLIVCIEGRVSNAGEKSTIDKSHAICNYTRGSPVCEDCSHSLNSCHYGGSTGATGSLAVDFGGPPGAGNEGVVGPQILQEAIACSQSLGVPLKRATCERASEGGTSVPCSDALANHVHISIAKCDKDNGPINTQ